ncbi:MAG: hypothetical protein DCF13_03545 [Flavobacteriaceae bacterium]|nr:MAG: hypothetical protein DCF13_03545 [Flavobacteriaceae bacterium]
MFNCEINKDYDILVSEPWDFVSLDGKNLIKGEIINIVSESCVIYRANHKLQFENIEGNILILSPRHREDNFENLIDEKLTFNCGLLKSNIELTENEDVLKTNSKFVLIASFKK